MNEKARQEMDLRRAEVLLTGGSSGIGLATARLLINKGAKDHDRAMIRAARQGAPKRVLENRDLRALGAP